MIDSASVDRLTQRRLLASMQGSVQDLVRGCAPWVGLFFAFVLVLSGLWLRDLDEQAHAPKRRTEVQVQHLKSLGDAGWKQWLGNEIVASSDVQKVADAWVTLTKEHPGLPSVAPARLAQVDGGRLTVTYTNEASADAVTAHATAAAEQMGAVQVWSDRQGFDRWTQTLATKRLSNALIALFALLLTGVAARGLWMSQWRGAWPWRSMMMQLGLSTKVVESALRRALGIRVGVSLLGCAAGGLLIFGIAGASVSEQDDSLSQTSEVFRPRTMEIPLASSFPCGPQCAQDPERLAEHRYLVDHKLAVLARQDRALDRHEKALRPWLWSLSRTPSSSAQRTVLAAKLVNPEIESRFSAWSTEDDAFRSSLKEVDALAQRMRRKETPSRAMVASGNRVQRAALHACDQGQAPWATRSLKPWVKGEILTQSKRERLEGLREPTLQIAAEQGTKVYASVGARVAAILRDTPGRFTLLLDSGQSWVWGLGGIAALEVHEGDRVKAGELLGEVARAAPQDEGESRLLVELWHGSRQADPRACFSKGKVGRALAKKSSKRRKSLGSKRRTRYTAR